jgi:electron transfer flavoprotein beta subunit
MQIVVLVKSIPDPTGVPSLDDAHLVDRSGEGNLDPGDEYAVEAGLKIAEAHGGEVTLVTMGPDNASAAIRKGLSMGGHGAVHVSDPALRGADVLATAKVLAAAIGRAPFDLILAGVESTDGSTGTLPMAVAELLGVPSLTFARSVEFDGQQVRIERSTDLGYDVVESALPALVTVTGSAADPRYPTLKGIMAAKSKPVETLALSDLDLSPQDVAAMQRVQAVTAAAEKGPGEVIGAGDDAVKRIADLLAEAKVI